MLDRPESADSGARPVDLSSLVVLRVLLGCGLAAWSIGLFARVAPFEGFLSQAKHYPYLGLEWVRPLPPNGLRAVALALIASGLGMAAGLRYRLASAVSALLVAYLFFVDSLYYDSVMFLIVLLVPMLGLSPAHAAASVDARRRAIGCRGAWTTIALLRFQVGAVYFFSGAAKWYPSFLSGDALHAMAPDYGPVRWLAPLLSAHAVYAAGSWLGMLFDVAIAPSLSMKKTRPYAFALALAFHLHNAVVLPLGAVPWVMIAATTVFLPPDWPHRLATRLRLRLSLSAPRSDASIPRVAQRFVAAYVGFSLLLPLRRWVTPGDPAFHEIGWDFTWALRSRAKHVGAFLVVVDRKTGTRRVDLLKDGLSYAKADRVWSDPYLLWWSAQEAARDEAARGNDVAVYATAIVVLNGGTASPMIDSSVDLTREKFPPFVVPRFVRLRELPREASR